MSRVAAETSSNATASTGRTIVSFLIFVHLFCVIVAVLANESGSLLEQALRQKVPGVRAYLQLLVMDLSYGYAYTYGAGENATADSLCWVDVELNLPDGTTVSESIPPANLWSRQRQRRYERLAVQSVMMVGNPTLESAVPGRIARRLVEETGATGGRVMCRWRQPPAEPFVTTGQQVRTRYEASLLVDPDDRSRIDLFKAEPASDVAPRNAKP